MGVRYVNFGPFCFWKAIFKRSELAHVPGDI